MIEILARPEFIVASVVIVGTALVALRLTAPSRGARGAKVRPAAPSVGPTGVVRPLTVPADRSHRPGPHLPARPPAVVPEADTGYRAETFAVSSGHPRVTFADVAGLDHAIAELREVKEYLSDAARFRALGAELPRGILLHGLPGCGKTLLARALAGETGVPFFFVSAASFVEKFVGLGAARVRELFEEAKRSAPSIIFIDELDAIGRSRNADSGGAREFDNTLNQLLVEIDGFLAASGVLVLGATNRPELIDPALLRPGRFDRRIEIDRPDRRGRQQILRLHASRRPFSGPVDWDEVAANSAGLTAAELANIVNEAALLAARRHQPRVSPEDVEEACGRLLAGTRISRLMGDDEKQLVAVHEGGHALLSVLLRGVTMPARVSIVSRSGAFDRSIWSASDDREILTKRELMAQLIVLLGGRAAELNSFGEPSTRAEDDLEHAATLARRMVERWAMTGRFELAGGRPDSLSHHLEGSAGGREVRELLTRAEQAARIILRDNATTLRAVADALVERETLSGAELQALAGRRGRHAGPAEVTTVARAGAGQSRAG